MNSSRLLYTLALGYCWYEAGRWVDGAWGWRWRVACRRKSRVWNTEDAVWMITDGLIVIYYVWDLSWLG